MQTSPEDELLTHIRAQLAVELGRDHPDLDWRAARVYALYLGSQQPEVQALVATFPPLSASQSRVLATLLTPESDGPSSASA